MPVISTKWQLCAYGLVLWTIGSLTSVFMIDTEIKPFMSKIENNNDEIENKTLTYFNDIFNFNNKKQSRKMAIGIPNHCYDIKTVIYQIQRSLCQHIFLSTMLPKTLYLTLTNLNSTDNMMKNRSCKRWANDSIVFFKKLLLDITYFIHTINLLNNKNDINIDIKMEFRYQHLNRAQNRNLLANMADNDNITYLQYFDGDDIIHPQRLQFTQNVINELNYLNINSIILHLRKMAQCRQYDELNEHIIFNQCDDLLSNRYNSIKILAQFLSHCALLNKEPIFAKQEPIFNP
eukprot:492561_1